MKSFTFEKNVRQLWGDAGIAWLGKLPSIISVLEKKWHLTNLIPSLNLSYNYILLGYQGEKPIALKIGFDQNVIKQEKKALRTYNGYGCVQLFDECAEYNALLLERAVSGVSLKSLFPGQDDQAVKYVAAVMQQLHKAPIEGAQFKYIQDWLALLGNPPAAVAHNKHVKKAHALAQELLASQGAPVLLHGDLHHDNILQAGDEWKAIDPKGILGEPAYEIGSFMCNPHPLLLQQQDPAAIMRRRLDIFTDILSIDRERLHAWSYVQAALFGCWSIQDGMQVDVESAMIKAKLLET